MANKRVPASQKALRGTVRKDRRQRVRTFAPERIGAAPAYFTESQVSLWREAIGSGPVDHFTRADRASLEAFCLLRSALEKAATEWNAAACPLTGRGTSGHKNRQTQNATLRLIRSLSADLRGVSLDLGMSPRARCMLDIESLGELVPDPLAKFL